MNTLPGAPAATQMSPAQRLAAIQARARERREQGELPTPFARGGAFVRVDGNTGEATYGASQTPFPLDHEYIIDIESIEHGIMKWKANDVVDRRMVSVLDGMIPAVPVGEPRRGELAKPNERDGWVPVYSVPLCGTQGDLKNVILRLDCSNDSSIRRAVDLVCTCIDRIQLSDEQPALTGARINPIVSIHIGSYHNKEYAKVVHFPEFKIVGWTDGYEREDVALNPPDGTAGFDLFA